MKILSLLWLMCASLFAVSIHDDGDFRRAVTSTDKEKTLILMIYTADDCPECAYMKQKVFTHESVAPYLARHFVVLEKNIHKRCFA